MDNFEEKRYTVDEIIDDVVRLQDMETEEIFDEDKYLLPKDIHDGSILIYDIDGYKLDLELEKEKKESLRERLERLKALKKNEEESE